MLKIKNYVMSISENSKAIQHFLKVTPNRRGGPTKQAWWADFLIIT